ncbi:MAG: tRNA uridine-5-carboxymethylaminomethyl(34) synthesis enzyme MnmG, partial [Candidatus Sumerlaeota bacterium]|nr:tRNA uridine-5-carboxymethylaminomethyl(34) synthesis enzyme MnmG [Candidatus Sumerlaeota bacterium]
RLALRHDTADLRLTETGWRVGLVRRERYERFLRRRDALEREIERLETLRPERELTLRAFERRNWGAPPGRPKASEILARPDSSPDILEELNAADPSVDPRTAEQAHLHFRYAGYLAKEAAQADRLRRLEDKRLPADFDYASTVGLRRETADKLARFRPTTLGQANRIAGVTPADIALLLVAMKAKGN